MKRPSLHINENYRAFVVQKFKLGAKSAVKRLLRESSSARRVDRADDVHSLSGIIAYLDNDRADHHKAVGQRGLP
jgi:hypothetical protein